MENNLFFILVTICIVTNIIRSVYEILKYKKVLRPDKVNIAIILIDMILLWISWFALCGKDIYRIDLPGGIRYLGFVIFGIGIIVFLIALFTIKTVESHEGDLITKGIYSKFRHPMYLGFILWSIGFPIYYGALFSFILSFFFIANILFWRYIEEKELEKRFSAYLEYKKKTIF